MEAQETDPQAVETADWIWLTVAEGLTVHVKEEAMQLHLVASGVGGRGKAWESQASLLDGQATTVLAGGVYEDSLTVAGLILASCALRLLKSSRTVIE